MFNNLLSQYDGISKEPKDKTSSDWFDWWEKQRFIQSLNRIIDITSTLNLNPQIIKIDNIKILILSEEQSSSIEEEWANKLVSNYKNYVQNRIYNNCYQIAKQIKMIGLSTHIISSSEGTSDFIGWGNHFINLKISENECIAFDLTTSANIDNNQGHFDILFIISKNNESILQTMNKLYGGEWSIVDSEN